MVAIFLTFFLGLVIQEATYGAAEAELGETKDNLLLDVTIPLQALVRNSQLHIPGGNTKVISLHEPYNPLDEITSKFSVGSNPRLFRPCALCLQILENKIYVP